MEWIKGGWLGRATLQRLGEGGWSKSALEGIRGGWMGGEHLCSGWGSVDGARVTWKAKLPYSDVLHDSEVFWWKSFQEGWVPVDGVDCPFDEPTAAECGTGKGTELSRRRRRLGRERRALDSMRI